MTAELATSEGFDTRQERARQACEAAGITWPGTWLPEGTALYQSGADKLRGDRARWRALPDAATAVPLVAEALAAEEPRDFTVSVGKLRLDERDGRLRAAGSDPGTPGLGYSDHAFRQLVQQVPGLRASEAPRPAPWSSPKDRAPPRADDSFVLGSSLRLTSTSPSPPRRSPAR